MILFENITKEFPNGTKALQDISFHIEPGEFLFIVGPSGAGKTTVLRLLIREIEPTKGKIKIEGKDISSIKKKNLSALRRQIGAVFQDYKLIEDRTVEENVALISEMIKDTQKEVDKHVKETLSRIGLSDKAKLFPSQLSGGELQRTAIARAFAVEPKILFADEPTGNLDLATAWEIMNVLGEINKTGTTVIISTHNQEFTKAMKKRKIELSEGRIIKDTKKVKEKSKKQEKKDVKNKKDFEEKDQSKKETGEAEDQKTVKEK